MLTSERSTTIFVDPGKNEYLHLVAGLVDLFAHLLLVEWIGVAILVVVVLLWYVLLLLDIC